MSEQLGLDEFLGDGGAVEDDEGFCGAVGVLADGGGDEFLSASGLAFDEDGGRGWGDAFEESEDFAHDDGMSDQSPERILL